MSNIPTGVAIRAKTNGPIVVNEAESGAVMMYIPVKFPLEDGEWSGIHSMCIVAKDGTPSQISIDTLTKVFSIDDSMDSILKLQDQDTSEAEFDVKGKIATWVDKKTGEDKSGWKIQYLNPAGESGGFKMPEPTDRKSLLTKYGSKFRALSGGKKSASAPSKPAPPKAPGKPAPPAGKKKAAPPSTLNDAWGALCKALPEKTEEELGEIWNEEIGKTEKDAADLDESEWGTLKVIFEGMVE